MGSGNMTGSSNVVAQGAVFVPAQQIVTNYNCTTCAQSNTTGHVYESAHYEDSFAVAGAIKTERFDCIQACLTDNDQWASAGESSCDYTENHDICHPCKCECGDGDLKVGDWVSETGCDCGHKKKESCGSPEDDIERRINAQVEKVISDLLSDVVNRCISSSLHDCVELVDE